MKEHNKLSFLRFLRSVTWAIGEFVEFWTEKDFEDAT
jgi:hypothetical protein